VNSSELANVMRRLGDAAIDPSAWPDVMDGICRAVGASAALLLQSDVRTADVPRTLSIDEGTQLYFKGNWHLSDPRAAGFPRMMAGEVVTDLDLLTPAQIRADPMYNELLFPNGFRWFAGVGFWAESAAWALTIQRTGREGPFESIDKRVLRQLAPRLTETATLATAVGRVAITAMTDVLNAVQQAALVLHRDGTVLGVNDAAQAGFDDEIRVRGRRLYVCDKLAAAKLAALFDRIRSTPDSLALPSDPVLVRRRQKPSVVVRALPIDGAARNVFLGARVLLTFSNLRPRAAPEPGVIAHILDLTPAESRLAALIVGGHSIDDCAEQLGISRETARNHLKSTFLKTGTHRQAELVSLVFQMCP
jgi:DNA-binding CsgD family transcriptional regulator